jgi:hypothetical protein
LVQKSQVSVIDPEDRDLFWFAETAQEIWDGILRWHDAPVRLCMPQREMPEWQ